MKSLMLKLLIIGIIGSSAFAFSANAKDTEKYIERFFHSVIDGRGSFEIKSVEVKDYKEVPELDGWRVYFVDIKIKMLKGTKEEVTAHEKVFTNGKYISKDFFEIRTKASLKNKVSVDMKDSSYYNKEHLIYGDGSEKDKMVIFSDPLCPFCQEFIPEFLNDIKANPGKIAVYYYHLPLSQIHPASTTISKAMSVASHRGIKDVVLKTYKSKDFFEFHGAADEAKILSSFNKALGVTVVSSDIDDKKIIQELKDDKKFAGRLMISGTPTIYLNGKKDNSRYKYKKILGLK